MKYTTVAKVKELYPDTSLSDSQIESLIETASSYIDTYVGYPLARDYSDGVKTLLFDGSGTDSLVLYTPVNGDITVESLDMSDNPSNVPYLVQYPLNEPYITYLGLRSGVFKAGMANYRISGARIGRYTVDFAPSSSNHTLPKDLIQASTAIAGELVNAGNLQSKNEITSGIKTAETTGSYSVNWANPTADTITSLITSAVPDAVKILDSYKSLNIV